MIHAINWFEIPVNNFERAKKFYSTLFDDEIREASMPDDSRYGMLPYDEANNGVGGGLMETQDPIKTVKSGIRVYLNGGEDLSVPLARVEAAGGTIVMPKTTIGENGFMALFIDTEGNQLALHSPK